MYLFVNSTTKGVQAKNLKLFFGRFFPFATSVNENGGWCNLSSKYLREYSENFEAALIGYSGAWGKLIHKKS
jgi:hypothetical protein